MNSINLIPLPRQRVNSTRRSARLWIGLNCGYACVLIAAGVVYSFSTAQAREADQPDTRRQLEQANTTLVHLRQEVSTMQAKVRSEAAFTKVPDWSAFLAALSGSLNDQVVLSKLDCNNISLNSTPTATFRIEGLSRSQGEIAQFVLKLERLRFFDKVRLLQTAPQAFHGCDAIGFELVCTIAKPTGEQR